MLEFLFFILVVVEIVLLFIYVRKLSELANYSNSNKIAIFGSYYGSVYRLYSDLNFLNNLFSGENVNSIENQLLRDKLVSLRKLLITQLMLGLLIFLVVFIAGNSK